MSRLPRIGSALSALALASVIAGCASPMSRQGHVANINKSDVGLALRAQLALAAGDFQAAVDLAERAVESKPEDAGMRALLGNVYFGSGRFASAEAAYRDTLTLVSNEPKVVLKLALVQIAQGQSGEALSFLNAASNVLDPADYGLALALAGQAHEAVAVLEPAARAIGADARVRQNLALAYGLSGDWIAARTIAAQDIPADQLDSRVRQWMALATPVRASDQVAALVGITPAANDPGQPVRLALRDSGERLAQLATSPAPVAQPSPEPLQVASLQQPVEAASVPVEVPYVPISTDEPVQEVAQYQPPAIAAAYEAPAAAEVVSAAPVPAVAEAAPPPPLVAALTPAKVEAAAPKPIKPRKAAKSGNGNAGVVVQLGAYSSRASIAAAWDKFAGQYASLRNYTPASARFDSSKGTVYRLSVKGFGSRSEASSLCSSLRSKGKSCFVRNVAGDAAVQFASR